MPKITQPGTSSCRRTAVSLLLFFAGLYLLTTRGTHTSVDDIPRFNLTTALLTARSIEIPPSIMGAATRVDDRTYCKYGIGMSLVMAPLWAVGETLNGIAPEGLQQAMERPHIFAMATTNQWLGALACLLLFLIARRLGYRDPTALAVAFSAGLASMLWLNAQTSFENVLVVVLIEAAVLALIGQGPLGLAAAASAGAAMGFVFLTRWADGWILLPGVAALLVARIRADARERPVKTVVAAAAFAVACAAGLALALIYSYARFLDPFELGYDDDNVSWRFFYRGLFGFLFSPAKSVFVFTPLLVLAVARFERLWRRLGGGWRAAGFFWLIGAPVAVYSLFETWDGGWCFGPRYLLPSVVLGLVVLGEWIEDERWGQTLWRRALFAALFGAGAYAQWVCLASNFNEYSDNYYVFRFYPESCPLWSCIGTFHDPMENLWFLKMIKLMADGKVGWSGLVLLAAPVVLFGAGLAGIRRELVPIARGALDWLRQAAPRAAKPILAAVIALALIALASRTREAWRRANVAEGAGLQASYFANAHWSPPAIGRVDARIDFNWSHRPRPFHGDFSVQWTGQIEAPTSGTYFFGLDACGTATLWLDGRVVVANPGPQPGRRLIIRSVHLAKGWHSIRIGFAAPVALDEYVFNRAKYARVRHLPTGVTLRWKPPGSLFLRTVPPSVLRPGPARTSF